MSSIRRIGGVIETNSFPLKVTLGTPANLSATPIIPETPNNVNPQDLVAQINKLSNLIYAALGPSSPGQPPAYIPIQAVGGSGAGHAHHGPAGLQRLHAQRHGREPPARPDLADLLRIGHLPHRRLRPPSSPTTQRPPRPCRSTARSRTGSTSRHPFRCCSSRGNRPSSRAPLSPHVPAPASSAATDSADSSARRSAAPSRARAQSPRRWPPIPRPAPP